VAQDRILQHRTTFNLLKHFSQIQLEQKLAELLKVESAVEENFRQARAKLGNSERQIGGLEGYGHGGKHYAFKNILTNFGIDKRDDLPVDVPTPAS
jgi:hypothetical protein